MGGATDEGWAEFNGSEEVSTLMVSMTGVIGRQTFDRSRMVTTG